MANNFNLKSATFGGQSMGLPKLANAALTGNVASNSSGVDVGLHQQKLVERHGDFQVSFNDLADALSMMITEFGLEKTLVLVTPDLAAADTTITIVNCTCKEVLINAQHNEYGAHIVLFEARYADGAANPVSQS